MFVMKFVDTAPPLVVDFHIISDSQY